MNYSPRHITPQAPAKLLRPRGFRRPAGILGAQFHVDGPWAGVSPRYSPAQRRGKSYERRVLEVLGTSGLFAFFTPSPWIRFSEEGTPTRFCQPDAMGFWWDEAEGLAHVMILEVKYSHTLQAYWQLRELYEPVVRHMFPAFKVHICEVTKNFDPSTPWPEPITLFTSVESLVALKTNEFGVLQWKPEGRGE